MYVSIWWLACAFPLQVEAFVGASLRSNPNQEVTSSSNRGSVVVCSGTKNENDWDKYNKLAKPDSYWDMSLLDFHNTAQDEKQGLTGSLETWNEEFEEELATISEWKDSFDRNGFADFTPPMTEGLNCLIVGDGSAFGRASSRKVRLPWDDVQQGSAVVTSIPVAGALMDGDDDDTDDMLIDTSGGGANLVPSGPTTTTSIASKENKLPAEEAPDSSSSSLKMVDPNKPAAAYDCIVDQGLMESILAVDNYDEETIQGLVFDAANAIREHGIYVVVTSTMAESTRNLIEKYSLEAGLEWDFILDGISNDEQVVSVARRFNNGAMPKMPKGWMSRYQAKPFGGKLEKLLGTSSSFFPF